MKWVALITMLIDHIGASTLAFLLHGSKEGTLWNIYNIHRDIGRIAFPIYILMLVEGMQHTRSKKRYLLRMGLFALISEVPFDLAFFRIPFHWHAQNVFFTLFIGLAVICAMDSFEKELEKLRKGPGKSMSPLAFTFYRLFLYGALILLGCCIAALLYTDYTFIGILAICAVWLLRRYPVPAAALCCLILTLSSPREFFALGCLVPISLYNGKRGRQPKYFFYAFYPVHLFLLWCVYLLLKQQGM
ncbi:MAG: conjugal transfer protein TraX [Lachnospiraceae bacterium]|nr:conjugal transfer protein TraX [Lachnospiraceae bacterium]